MNALQPLFPTLHILTPLGLPATFHDWYASASAGQAARLAGHLEAELRAVVGAGGQVDHDYLRSEAFQANVVQAVRAAEIAESDGKLRLIARALSRCTLVFPAPAVDKFQTMRLIEALSLRELSVLGAVYGLLDPIDPYADAFAAVPLAGLSRQETESALLGLAGLGLLRQAEDRTRQGWQLTPLARQVALLGRLSAE